MSETEDTDTEVEQKSPEERGWTRDIDERRGRRPKQKIDTSDRESGGNLVLTPAWVYACTQCGHERRLATEDVGGWKDCPDCGEIQRYEPLGELVYP